MSAFLCSDKHLSLLASQIVRHVRTNLNERHVFNILLVENMLSLHARYGDWPATDGHAFVSAVNNLPAIAVIKQIHCYEYQSCEHEGWECSDAKDLVGRLEAHLIHDIPGYEDAPWGIN